MQYTESINSLVITNLDLERDLFHSIIPKTEVILLDRTENNPEVIAEVLSEYTNITNLHLVGDSEDWISVFSTNTKIRSIF